MVNHHLPLVTSGIAEVRALNLPTKWCFATVPRPVETFVNKTPASSFWAAVLSKAARLNEKIWFSIGSMAPAMHGRIN
jgi:hypothetical protein